MSIKLRPIAVPVGAALVSVRRPGLERTGNPRGPRREADESGYHHAHDLPDMF
jgi:hypothetical protein